MKKMSKLTRKLLLSALALGLAVVTLTTTTYAWYTSSNKATAGTGEASTSSSTKDASLLISSDEGENKVFASSATIATCAVDLVPVYYNGTDFYELNGSVASTNYYKFTLYFKTTSDLEDVPVYIATVVIDNSTTPKVEYDSLVQTSGTGEDGLPNKSKYWVDVINALDLRIENNNTENNEFDYDLSAHNLSAADNFSGFITGSTPNAINYYNKFMGADKALDPADAPTLTPFTKDVAIGTIPAGEILEVTFYVYLNGWDNYCFDVCRGQSFTIDIEFTTKK